MALTQKIFDYFKKNSPSNNPIKQQSGISKRYFNAAKLDRFTASWLATTNSINQELKNDLDRLRARGRDLIKNNEYGKKFQKMVISNVVGPAGFNLQARATDYLNGKTVPSTQDNNALEESFFQWSKKGICEVTGKMNFVSLCRLLMSGMPSDGEFLVRIVRGAAANNEYGIALQAIDVDRLDTQYSDLNLSNGNKIVMGVEINEFSRPIAYYILSAHPSDNTLRKRERHLAEDIIHGYMLETAEQMRGVPWMAAGILSLHHLGKFEESALLAARKGADTLGFFTSVDGISPNISDGTDSAGNAIEVSVPGTFDTLPDGVDYKPHESKYPDSILEPFTKGFLRRVASGFNVSYNGFANDLEGVNFSSIRAGVIEERDQWMTIQNWFSEVFLTVIYEEWLKSSLLRNMITLPSGSPLPASRLEKFKSHYWQARRWQWVDPAKDIAAARESVKSAVLSPQMIAAQQGVDITQVIEDLRLFEQLTADLKTVNYGNSDLPPTAVVSTDPNEEA